MPRAIDESVSSEAYRAIDQMREALSAHLTGGLSPASLALALIDWNIHLAAAPGKRLELIDKAVRKSARLSTYLAAAAVDPETPPCIEPLSFQGARLVAATVLILRPVLPAGAAMVAQCHA
jgi:polyhydroxyalkanoate synthase